MIGYVTLGANNIETLAKFYDALFSVTGAKRLVETSSFILWGNSMKEAGFALAQPFDGNKATNGNGTMIALRAKSKAEVNAIYNKALELGATDEGAPGDRSDYFYAGYFRDIEGNKLNAFFTELTE